MEFSLYYLRGQGQMGEAFLCYMLTLRLASNNDAKHLYFTAKSCCDHPKRSFSMHLSFTVKSCDHPTRLLSMSGAHAEAIICRHFSCKRCNLGRNVESDFDLNKSARS